MFILKQYQYQYLLTVSNPHYILDLFTKCLIWVINATED